MTPEQGKNTTIKLFNSYKKLALFCSIILLVSFSVKVIWYYSNSKAKGLSEESYYDVLYMYAFFYLQYPASCLFLLKNNLRKLHFLPSVGIIGMTWLYLYYEIFLWTFYTFPGIVQLITLIIFSITALLQVIVMAFLLIEWSRSWVHNIRSM